MSTSTPPAWKWRDECAAPLATDPCPDCGGSHKPWVLCHEYAQMREEALSEDSCKTTSPVDSSCVVESCPECGIEYETLMAEGYREMAEHGNHEPNPCTRCGFSPCECDGDTEMPDRIPFAVQEFMFEELCEEKLAELPHLIFTHSERIIEMARDRFRDGYKLHGSKMYSWTPERRLYETLCEIADSVVYPTSGPIE